MLGIIAKSLRTGVLTETRSSEAPPSFGFPVIDFSPCVACDECARSCPTGAIQTAASGQGQRTVTLSYGACIQCRECVTACPEQAVSVSHEVEVAAYTRQQLARTASFDVDPATGRGTFVQVEAHAGLSLHESAERLRERIRGRLGRSLHVRQVDAGSATRASWKSPPPPTRGMTWSASESTWWRAPGTPTSCLSPDR
jgi:formate hydrogenlyase subunit 6/NADH:ubiquinone oxidoreductase subunit I